VPAAAGGVARSAQPRPGPAVRPGALDSEVTSTTVDSDSGNVTGRLTGPAGSYAVTVKVPGTGPGLTRPSDGRPGAATGGPARAAAAAALAAARRRGLAAVPVRMPRWPVTVTARPRATHPPGGPARPRRRRGPLAPGGSGHSVGQGLTRPEPRCHGHGHHDSPAAGRRFKFAAGFREAASEWSLRLARPPPCRASAVAHGPSHGPPSH
jgi:hypothetical protein